MDQAGETVSLEASKGALLYAIEIDGKEHRIGLDKETMDFFEDFTAEWIHSTKTETGYRLVFSRNDTGADRDFVLHFMFCNLFKQVKGIQRGN